MSSFQPVIGIFLIILIAYLFSENRVRVSWVAIVKGLGLQFSLAIFLLKFSLAQSFFQSINNVILSIQQATQAGTTLVFGYLGGGPLPFLESKEGLSFILGFQALPMMLVFSALSAVLYYLRILPVVIGAFSWGLGRLLNISGAASFAVISTIFVGMVEAPLLIRPYLKELSRTELFIVMSSGMATISGTVLVIYAAFLQTLIHA
jgi:CNT family concentrative nucleoside transporter